MEAPVMWVVSELILSTEGENFARNTALLLVFSCLCNDDLTKRLRYATTRTICVYTRDVRTTEFSSLIERV